MAETRLIPILREGVEMAKIILFRQLKAHFSLSYPQKDEQYIRRLAAVVINELFEQEHTGEPLYVFAEENRYVVQKELESMSTHLKELRIPITDALRIQFLCDHQEGVDSTSTLEKAQKLGILITEREVPLPAKFIHMIRKIGISQNLIHGN